MKRGSIAALVFALWGLLLIPYTGIESDEALFATPFYRPVEGFPAMVFPYIGSLKTLLYWPILHFLEPNAYSIRLPMVLLAALTILLFSRLAEKLAGSRAAIIAVFLLATDPSFLITTTYDWGPVALQIVLTVGACLLIACNRPALGFFCFGLALWNKAIFGWTLAGLLVAAACVYGPELRARLTRATILRCTASFLLGALPLIVHNVQHSNATFAANARFGFDNLPARATVLKQTLDGSNLFGYITAPDSDAPPQTPADDIPSLIRDQTGAHHSNLLFYGLLASLLAAPLWWRSSARRAAIFAILTFAIGFLAITAVRYTGYVHHIVLLWPMPQLFVGAVLASLRLRGLAVALAALLVGSNLLVDNEWLADLQRVGTQGLFTDAIYPLSKALSKFPDSEIHLTDFGMFDNLTLLREGRCNLHESWRDPQPLINPTNIYVAHAPDYQIEQGIVERLNASALASHYQKQTIQTIRDAHGRAVFELFRFGPMVDEGPLSNEKGTALRAAP